MPEEVEDYLSHLPNLKKPPLSLRQRGPGGVVAAAYSRVCRGFTAFESTSSQRGPVAVDTGEAAGIWPPQATTNRSANSGVSWSSEGVHPGHRRQWPQCGSCSVSSPRWKWVSCSLLQQDSLDCRDRLLHHQEGASSSIQGSQVLLAITVWENVQITTKPCITDMAV